MADEYGAPAPVTGLVCSWPACLTGPERRALAAEIGRQMLGGPLAPIPPETLADIMGRINTEGADRG